jgi:hypothetical protein
MFLFGIDALTAKPRKTWIRPFYIATAFSQVEKARSRK